MRARMGAWALTAGLLAICDAATAAPRGHAAPQVRTLAYDPSQVALIRTAPRRATELEFEAESAIDHVALGETAGWDVAVAGSRLFLKPKAGAHQTNLIVTTSGAGGSRTYAFELSLGGARRGPARADYVVRIEDQRASKEQTKSALAAARSALEAKIVQLRLERGALEGPRNLAYAAQGSAELQPSEVSDNGRFTVLRFPGGQPIPAVSTVDAAGREALARFSVRGEFVVVEGAWPGLRLRKGGEVTCLTNLGFQPGVGGAPSRTASPDVRRTDKASVP